MVKQHIRALIWDFDGTLVNTMARNYHVNRRIAEQLLGEQAARIPALRDLETYVQVNRSTTNWRSFYAEVFGYRPEQIDQAGALWTPFQLNDPTPTPLFPGMHEMIQQFQHVSQFVVSQNSSQLIRRSLEEQGVLSHFQHIVGYEEVARERQKPAADGVFLCLGELTMPEPGRVVFIGDHTTDVQCARAAAAEMQCNGYRHLEMRVIGVQFERPDEPWLGEHPDVLVNTTKKLRDALNAWDRGEDPGET